MWRGEREVRIVTGYWLNSPGFKFLQRQEMLSCPELYRPWLGLTGYLFNVY